MEACTQHSILAIFSILGGCHSEPSLDVSVVNNLVPIAHRQELVFVPHEASFGLVKYTLPVPKGWESESDIGELSTNHFRSNMSFMVIHSSCDHTTTCIPKDWNKMIEGIVASLRNRTLETSQWNEKKASSSGEIKLERNAWVNGRRVLRTRDSISSPPTVAIDVFWWPLGSAELHRCGAQLSSDLAEAADAFEKACQLAEVQDPYAR